MNLRILPPALWTLHWLNFRARLRKIGRGCRTVRGALGLLAFLGMFGIWLTSFFVQRSHVPPNPYYVRDFLPFGLLGMCVLNVVFSKSGEGIAFRPAEVEFLFPAPFRRRELLLHRIVGNSLVLLPTGLIFSMFMYPYVSFWLAGFAGTYLALQFVTLFQIVVGLFAGSVRERVFSRARLGIAVLIVLGLAASLVMTFRAPVSGGGSWMVRLRDVWPVKVLLFPFDIFGKTVTAAGPGELAVWGGAACGLNLLLVGLVFWLDMDYREAALKTSQRIYQRIQSARRGRVYWLSGTVNVRRLRWVRLPRLYGAGPVASCQLTSALRSAKGLIPLLLFMVVVAGLPVFLVNRSLAESVLPALAAPVVMFLLIVFPQFLQFDFRGDVDRIDLLKMLPLGRVAIACGQLLAPTIFLLAIELCLLGAMTVSGALSAGVALAIVPFLPLGNLIVFAVENLIWLLYPYRMAVAGAADFQAMVRQMLLMMLKLLVLGLVFGMATGAGFIGWFLSDSFAGGLLAAWCACAASCGGLVPLVAWAFGRFDPATDSPA
jgi:hypothetical protein